jgi:cytochrome c-type biogenesis protein CcmE
VKSKHIVILVIIAVGIAAILGTYGDASTTVSFSEAAENPDKSFHVKTYLVKEKGIEFDAEVDPEKFVFYGKDSDGEIRKVICLKEKPAGFEHSEEIKLIGHTKGTDEFVATDLQTKCPSKYENEIKDI